MAKTIDAGAQMLLKMNQNVQMAKNNPFSEHNTAMDKLTNIQKDRPRESTPLPGEILDHNGKLVR